MKYSKDYIFGFVKPLVDVHTMGIYTMINLLRDCGFKVFFANDAISHSLENVKKLNNYSLVKKGLEDNRISCLCYSYRLDPQDGCDFFMSLFEQVKSDKMLVEDGGNISVVSFAGLPDTCDYIFGKTKKLV